MRIITIALAVLATSCGIIQRHVGESNYDPEFHKKRMAELNQKKETKERDSLTQAIQTSSLQFPPDLTETTLIVETYNYADFLNIQANKFYRPEDSKKQRKFYARYSKEKRLLLKDYPHKVVYADKPEYENLDQNEFRYVLKTISIVQSKDEEVVIYKDGSTAGWFSARFYYLYDRQTKKVVGKIEDINTLLRV